MAANLATLKLRLAEAEEAYHNVATGQQARVFVDQNGERVEYTATNLERLRAYISLLQGMIADGECSSYVRKPTGPARFIF